MTTYTDLSPYKYSKGAVAAGSKLNIGWLGSDQNFPTGRVDPAITQSLLHLAAAPKNVMRGFHYCDFCDIESPVLITDVPGGGAAVLGTGEIHVRGAQDLTYVAPTLVIHYIDTHDYLPPLQFLDAVHALRPA